MTTIREATLDDVPQIVALGRDLHDESPMWRRLAYVDERVAEAMRAMILSPAALVLVGEKDGQIVAGIACITTPHWSSYDMVAQEASFFVTPALRGTHLAPRLIKRMAAWAFDQGCVMLQAGTSTGVEPERCALLYEAMGFTRTTIGLEQWWGTGDTNGN